MRGTVSGLFQRCPAGGVVILDQFVSLERCDFILEELEFAFWSPTQIIHRTSAGSFNTVESLVRRSENTGEEWFGAELRQEVSRIEKEVCGLLRLDLQHLEPWQAARYERGGYFDAHLDAGPFGEEPSGEREVTLLIYLSTPGQGGSTTFPELDLDIRAQAGRLAAWNNLLPDGTVNPRMKHAACPVRNGTKLTLTTWARQRPFKPNTSEGS
jgi:prolyl 4-hydroxylase